MAAENGMPENEDVRTKALLRLGIAGAVTAAALAGLWWLDQGAEKRKPTPEPPAAPAPIVPAPPPETAPPQAETPAGEKPGAEPTEPAPAAKPVEPPAEPPPPPKVSNAPKAPPPPPSPARPATPPPAVKTAAAPTPPAPSPAPAPVPVPPGKGFVVQVGVFSNPDNAREMVDKLNKQGIRAHLEARVQLGPFLNRQEAEKAQAEMRKLGYNALVTAATPVK